MRKNLWGASRTLDSATSTQEVFVDVDLDPDERGEVGGFVLTLAPLSDTEWDALNGAGSSPPPLSIHYGTTAAQISRSLTYGHGYSINVPGTYLRVVGGFPGGVPGATVQATVTASRGFNPLAPRIVTQLLVKLVLAAGATAAKKFSPNAYEVQFVPDDDAATFQCDFRFPGGTVAYSIVRAPGEKLRPIPIGQGVMDVNVTNLGPAPITRLQMLQAFSL